MSGKNLKIRITMGSSAAPRKERTPPSVSTTTPDSTSAATTTTSPSTATRRYAAVAAAIAILAGAGWLAFSGGEPATPPNNDLAAADIAAPASPDPVIHADAASTNLPLPPAPPPLAEATTATAAPKAVQPVTPAKATPTPTVKAQKATEQKSPAKTTKPASKQPKAASSNNVARAVLTSGISKREPIDKLGAQVSADDGKKNLFFFTEIVDLKGGTVTHRWKREGKTVANMKFRVGSDRYRVYSNKSIAPADTGEWQVEIVDAQGKTLQVANFRYE